MEIVRLKCVSQCLGIRRVEVTYVIKKNGSINLSNKCHPLNKFNDLKLDGNNIIFNDESNELLVGEDVFFYQNNKVESLGNVVVETIAIGCMVLPIEKSMEEFYLDAINKDYIFDEFNGEFEYLLYIMSKYELKNNEKTFEYYEKAKAKGFRFEMIEE